MLATTRGEYPFSGLPNTRDLGGMRTGDGRTVRPGLLLRSSALSRATSADRELLLHEWRLHTVVDLRSTMEIDQDSYDRTMFPGVEFELCPVLSLSSVGVSREEVSGIRKALVAFAKLLNPGKLMRDLYSGILTDEQGILAYRSFFQIALRKHEGALLWHCTLGKDRAGLATALLLYVLGVSMPDIEADYLATNDYMDAFGQAEHARTLETYHLPQFMLPAVRILNAVKVDYLRAAIRAAEQSYGSLDAYLQQALRVTPEMKEQLKDRYLHRQDD